eukprot:470392_1
MQLMVVLVQYYVQCLYITYYIQFQTVDGGVGSFVSASVGAGDGLSLGDLTSLSVEFSVGFWLVIVMDYVGIWLICYIKCWCHCFTICAACRHCSLIFLFEKKLHC